MDLLDISSMRPEDDNDCSQEGGEIFWNTQQIERMVDLYQGYPELYDSKHPQYREKTARAIAFQNIATAINTTGQEVSRKIRNLRTQYGRYRTEFEQMSPEQKQSGGTFSGKRRWLLSIMAFLGPFIKTIPKLPVSSRDNINDDFLSFNKSANSNDSCEVTESQQPYLASTLDEIDETPTRCDDESESLMKDGDFKQEVVDDNQQSRVVKSRNQYCIRTRVSQANSDNAGKNRLLRVSQKSIGRLRTISKRTANRKHSFYQQVENSNVKNKSSRNVLTKHYLDDKNSATVTSDAESDNQDGGYIKELMAECRKLIDAVTVAKEENRDDMSDLGNSDVEFGRYVVAELLQCKNSDAKAIAKLKISQALLELHLHRNSV